MGIIKVLFPASPPPDDWSIAKLANLDSPLQFVGEDFKPCPQDRAEQFVEALKSREIAAILCGRGGYGSVDILSYFPWKDLARYPAKLIVGYSDISCIHSAMLSRLGWHGLHAQMPASLFWRTNQQADVSLLARVLDGRTIPPMSLKALNRKSSSMTLSGRLFGGCLSVLCSLIGTPFFPNDLKGNILFLEDVNENEGQVRRHIFQLEQSGYLEQCTAVIFGCFSGRNAISQSSIIKLAGEIGRPCYSSSEFGHTCSNRPLLVGAEASIESDQLTWHL